jgi:hypothetical protein
MLFLIADVIINMTNRRMRNTKHTETSLPNEFFGNQIVGIKEMRAAVLYVVSSNNLIK